MPFKTETFYGRIKLGDFTLRKHQMDDLLEPQESTPLEIEKIDEVLNDNFQLQSNKATLRTCGFEEFVPV